jgi:hypothetical protein
MDSRCQFAAGHTGNVDEATWVRTCACGLYEWLDMHEKAEALDYAEWYGDGLGSA